MNPHSASALSPHEEDAVEDIRFKVQFRHRVGQIGLDVQFELTKPWTVLFAPSGAGKTTILRVIAGLERPQSSRVAAAPVCGQAETVFSDSKNGWFIPPHRRLVRMVSQRPSLFPHMTVERNVVFGMGPAAGGSGVEGLLRMCRVWELRDKMPHQLSGGEQQRVALARALGPAECRLLMLDEVFAGMDARLRGELMAELKRWQAGRKTPILHVTHDVGEVFEVGAEVLRLEGGRIVARGAAEVVLAEERSRLKGVLG